MGQYSKERIRKKGCSKERRGLKQQRVATRKEQAVIGHHPKQPNQMDKGQDDRVENEKASPKETKKAARDKRGNQDFSAGDSKKRSKLPTEQCSKEQIGAKYSKEFTRKKKKQLKCPTARQLEQPIGEHQPQAVEAPGPPNIPSPIPPPRPSHAPPVRIASNTKAEMEKWAVRALDKGVHGLREEFITALRRYIPPGMTKTAFRANWEARKNRDLSTHQYYRYRDVPCQDQNRVILNWPDQQTDYIHANYIATPLNPKRFICTQAPLETTIVDFWHMTILEECENILMLCNTLEDGMEKCTQYWPPEEKGLGLYGDIEITNTMVRPMLEDDPSVQVSYLRLKFILDGLEQFREVRHYHWLDWPDKGVPTCRSTALEMLSHVRGSTKPIIVHCSAGIGRTGTIVAIEFVLERLQCGESCEQMDDLLRLIRAQRPYSIQTDIQYLFVHRVLLYYFFEKYHTMDDSPELLEKYKKFAEDYEKATS